MIRKIKQLIFKIADLKTSAYIPFIILGRGRTGTNLLKDSINNHPDLYCYSEIFNVGTVLNPPDKLQNTTAYFRMKVFKPFPRNV